MPIRIIPGARTREFEASLQSPELWAKRASGSFDVAYNKWTNRPALAKSIRLQQRGGHRSTEWHPLVPLADNEGYGRPVPLDHPTRLLRLAQDEARAVAAELVRTNPDGLDRGEQLTGEQYQFLLRQVMDRLRKQNQLPAKTLSGERLGAFEQPFWEVLHRAGLI